MFLTTFVAILFAHAIGDFVLQTRWMIANKSRWWVLGAHVLIVSIGSVIALGQWHTEIVTVIFLTHLAMDALKQFALPQNAKSFLADQAVHIAVLVILAVLYPTAVADGFWGQTGTLPVYGVACILGAGAIFAVLTGGHVIGLALKKFSPQIEPQMSGLSEGGKYIGWMERAIVFLLMVINQPTAVGFLITAKSILRFNDMKNNDTYELHEYIIIGTLMSFGWALGVGAIAHYALTLAQTAPIC